MIDVVGKLHLSEPNCKLNRWWVPYLNFAPEIRNMISPPERVFIHEVFLRESNQHPRVALKEDEMVHVAKLLDELGVARIEFYPVVSDEDRAAMKTLSKENLRADLSALCRVAKLDIDSAVDSGATHIMLEIPGNPYIFKAMWGINEEQFIHSLVEHSIYAKERGVKVSVMPWDTYRPFYEYMDFFETLYKSLCREGKADGIVTSDTFGMSIPPAVMFVIKKIKSWCPSTPIEMHGHNDYGLGTAVMLSAVMAGAEYVHTAFNGIGERSGNAPTEEVVMAIEALLGVPTGIKLEMLSYISKLIEELTKIRMPSNKAVVGDALFTYESGLVVDAILKLEKQKPLKELAAMPFHPTVTGRKGYSVILGKGAGQANIEYKLRELGMEIPSDDKISQLLTAIKKEALIRKWEVPDEALQYIIEKIIRPT
jgi:isopropylmalate/homocitrate/citramalate synthase